MGKRTRRTAYRTTKPKSSYGGRPGGGYTFGGALYLEREFSGDETPGGTETTNEVTEYAMPTTGDVIAGKYRLDKVAGEGGMGIVYAAEHLVLRQRVAVKILLPDAATSDAVVERFAREAQAAAKITSEHVARVMDAGSLSNGAPFLVMEYLEGCDLEELLELQGTLPSTDVVDYMLQALEALAHAHAAGIVHRDLKPANLFLACRADGANIVKMLDFGISKTLKARPEDKVLTGQAVLGSPVYMSPEQLRNAKLIDGRADLWSVGVVAYELLTGRPPFDGDGVGEIFAAILEKDAIPVTVANPKLPPGLSLVINKCLKRNVDERWSDAADLARALAPFGSGDWTNVVDRIEQVLTRAKMFTSQPTPLETKRVIDAIAAAAERVRTTTTSAGDESAPIAIALTVRKPEAVTREDGVKTRILGAFLRMPRSRRIAAAAAVSAVIVGIIAVSAAGSHERSEETAPVAARAYWPADPQGRTAAPAEPDPSTMSDDAPMVMDLPETPGQNGSSAARSRGKAQKPPAARPKFLNSRE